MTSKTCRAKLFYTLIDCLAISMLLMRVFLREILTRNYKQDGGQGNISGMKYLNNDSPEKV